VSDRKKTVTSYHPTEFRF